MLLKPSVGILLLNWKSSSHTRNCIRSLERLSYSNYTICVVDNASKDGSVEEIGAAYPDVTVIENECNLGFAGGVNVGMEYLLELVDYVWLLNNDAEIVDAEALTNLVEVCERDNGVGSAGSLIVDTAGEVWFSGATISGVTLRGSHKVDVPSAVRETEYVTGCSLLIPTRVLRSVGFMSTDYFLYYEDADFGRRLAREGYRQVVVPSSEVRHYVGGSSERDPRINYVYYNLRNRFLFAKLWCTALQMVLFYLYVTIETMARLVRYMLKGNFQSVKVLVRAYVDGARARSGKYDYL